MKAKEEKTLNYSFSTVLMAILTSNILIIVIVLCMRNQKVMLSIGYKLLILFLLLTAMRFLLPLELPFAKNIYFPEWLSAIIGFARHDIFSFGIIGISPISLFGYVWLGGTLYHLYRLYKRKAEYRHYLTRYGENQKGKEPYQGMMDEICAGRRNPIWVKRVHYYGSPMQFGTFQPYIVIPSMLELSDEDLYHVLRHETAHYYHHDALIKDAIGFIRAVYWWNPLCKRLEEKTDLLLEMRVDDKLVDGNPDVREAYCQTLERINEKLQEGPSDEPDIPGASAAISMPALRNGDLKYREVMMYRDRGKKSVLFYLLAALVIAVYICSYCFTLEAYAIFSWDKSDLVDLEDAFYAVPQPDGTYDIYLIYNEGDVLIDNVDTLEQYIGISIKKD